MSNQFIAKLLGLAELSPVDVAALEHITAAPQPFNAKRDLIREGDPTGPLFIMLEGWACRYKILPDGGRQIMAFMIPGDACDLHNNMLETMDHSIQTLTEAKVCVIPQGAIQVLMNDHPAVARAMYLAQLVDQGTLREWIVSMGRRTSLQRVAHLMCELYLRARAIGLSVGPGMVLPLSQVVLADALGMTPVHINRIIRELRLAGAMTISRNNLEILDSPLMFRIAGFDDNYLHRKADAPR